MHTFQDSEVTVFKAIMHCVAHAKFAHVLTLKQHVVTSKGGRAAYRVGIGHTC